MIRTEICGCKYLLDIDGTKTFVAFCKEHSFLNFGRHPNQIKPIVKSGEKLSK
jgi:hypothetical protein